MSKSAGTTSTTTSSALPSFQQPYVDQMLGEAQKLYGTGGPQFYPGSTVEGFTQQETEGRNLLQATAGDMYNRNVTQLTPAVGQALGAFDVANDPTLRSAAEAAIRPVYRGLTEEALPAIRREAVGTGNLGASRQGIAEGLAISRANQTAADTTAQMYNAARSQGLDALVSTLGMYPTLQSAYATPGTLMTGLGEQERAMNQARTNEDMARWSYEQNLPYQALADYSNYIRGTYGGQGTSEVTAEGGSDWLSALGLGLQTAPWWAQAGSWLRDLFT
ncbi:MAG TPA: hypothetical protein VLH56_18965 [Dissulfurispiraceae bacterium]|nr:hypothetical protein [Dissulfurispiraceae bacterium]